MTDAPTLTIEEAIAFVASDLQQFLQGKRQRDYGHEIWVEGVSNRWAWTRSNGDSFLADDLHKEASPVFYEAIWTLSLRGILRPGVIRAGMQSVDSGYCLSEFGRSWIAKADSTEVLLLELGSLSRVLQGYSTRFGTGFLQRSQEAIRCRRAEAWLACCAMVGAAAEAVLLAAATAKTEDEEQVLKAYHGRDGRRQIMRLVTGGQKAHVVQTFETFMGLLSYWRDDAAHGRATVLELANADEAMRQLLHLCQWVDKEWELLTS